MDTRELIESIGGPEHFARLIGAVTGKSKAPKPQAVRQWGVRNVIPHKWRIWAYRAARQASIKITRDEIGVEKL